MDEWPFDQPRDVAVITTRRVISRSLSVVSVFHSEDDDGWIFMDGQPFEAEDGAVVALEEMVGLDPTLIEIASLPPGWEASRESPGGPWIRVRSPPES